MLGLFAAKVAGVSLPGLQQCSGSIVFREFGTGDFVLLLNLTYVL